MGKRLHRQAGHRARVHDVATLAECSTATVSRALNYPDSVGSEVRKRVYDAAKQLGYAPNNAARALRSRTTRIFGTVIPTLDHAIYARQVNAIENRLAEHGYSLIVTTSSYDLARELAQARMLVGRGAEGVILVGDRHHPDLYELLDANRLPYVNTYVYNARSAHPCVGFDNAHAGRQIANYLVNLGHERIGMIAGITKNNDRAAERVAGARACLEDHGLTLPDRYVVEKPYSIKAGRDGLRSLIALEDAPTAVICGSDILAFGALAEGIAIGLTVPDDLSIVGFDNLEFAAHLNPPLTTLEVPAAEMGSWAAEYLVGRLKGSVPLDACELETKLIVRGTASRPPKR